MENQSYHPRQILIAIVSLISLFIIVIITIFILQPILHQTSITPPSSSNISSLLDSASFSKIETAIKTLLTQNYQSSPNELNNLTITIRENTFTHDAPSSDESPTVLRFLVDLNSPELTYQVSYFPKSKSTTISCPPIEQAQNANIFCIADDNQSTIDASLDKYLPYFSTTVNGVDYSISHHSEDSFSEPYLSVYASVCGDESVAAEVTASINEWLKSKGIPDPSIIPIKFPHSYCNDRN